jgi:hypothetical protein
MSWPTAAVGAATACAIENNSVRAMGGIATAIHPAATHMSFPLKLDRIALKCGFAPIKVAIPYSAQWLSFRSEAEESAFLDQNPHPVTIPAGG